MPDSYVSSMGSAFTETGYPPTADRDGDRNGAAANAARAFSLPDRHANEYRGQALHRVVRPARAGHHRAELAA